MSGSFCYDTDLHLRSERTVWFTQTFGVSFGAEIVVLFSETSFSMWFFILRGSKISINSSIVVAKCIVHEVEPRMGRIGLGVHSIFDAWTKLSNDLISDDRAIITDFLSPQYLSLRPVCPASRLAAHTRNKILSLSSSFLVKLSGPHGSWGLPGWRCRLACAKIRRRAVPVDLRMADLGDGHPVSHGGVKYFHYVLGEIKTDESERERNGMKNEESRALVKAERRVVRSDFSEP